LPDGYIATWLYTVATVDVKRRSAAGVLHLRLAMLRSLAFDRPFTLDDATAVVEVAPAQVVPFTLELALLVHEAVTGLELVSASGQRVVLTVDEGTTWAITGDRGPDRVEIALGRNQVEHLHATLLRAYRDGRAEVDHVHVEPRTDGVDVALTIVFDEFAPPMSPEAAARLLARA
jgi:hypothetical protein